MTSPRTLAVALPTLALLLGACSPTITTHGHRFDADQTGAIKPGITSKQEVAQLMGSPSTLATFDDDRWYYVSQRTERKSFYQAEITDQQVLAITFGPDNMVKNVERTDLAQAEDISPVSDVTADRRQRVDVGSAAFGQYRALQFRWPDQGQHAAVLESAYWPARRPVLSHRG